MQLDKLHNKTWRITLKHNMAVNYNVRQIIDFIFN